MPRPPTLAVLLPAMGGTTTLTVSIYSDSHVWLGFAALLATTLLSALWILIPQDSEQKRLWWCDRSEARRKAAIRRARKSNGRQRAPTRSPRDRQRAPSAWSPQDALSGNCRSGLG